VPNVGVHRACSAIGPRILAINAFHHRSDTPRITQSLPPSRHGSIPPLRRRHHLRRIRCEVCIALTASFHPWFCSRAEILPHRALPSTTMVDGPAAAHALVSVALTSPFHPLMDFGDALMVLARPVLRRWRPQCTHAPARTRRLPTSPVVTVASPSVAPPHQPHHPAFPRTPLRASPKLRRVIPTLPSKPRSSTTSRRIMGEHHQPPWASPPSAPSSSAPRPPPAPATAVGRPGPWSRTSGVLYNINTEESRIGLHNGNSLPLLQPVCSKASFSSYANLLDLYWLLSGAPNLVLSTVRNHPASDSESAGADIALSRVKSLPVDSSGEVISSGGRTDDACGGSSIGDEREPTVGNE
jgi:hypothetical protein